MDRILREDDASGPGQLHDLFMAMTRRARDSRTWRQTPAGFRVAAPRALKGAMKRSFSHSAA